MDRNAYLGNINLKPQNTSIQFTKEQIEEYLKCSQDPIYFIENYIKIINVDDGLVPFNMWDYQKNLVKTIHNNRFTIAKLPRQYGKSTTVVAYILHYVLFNKEVNVGILANKEKTARNLLEKIKTAYEHLPKWMQQGIGEWNKGSIVLENKSRVDASSTSTSAIRGGSYNLILLDEFAHIDAHIADDFYSSAYPTITSGKTTKLVIVSTPRGLNLFYKLWTEAVEKRSKLIPIEGNWWDLPGRDAAWKEETIQGLGGENGGRERFRQEFECDFIGSTNTLIHSNKLKCLSYKVPLYKDGNGLKVYEEPCSNHTYVMVVDTARGSGLDYNAFVVVDITRVPYRVVATFRNNEMSPVVYPNVILPVARKFADAFILVEINDIGAQVAEILYNEMEYENVLMASVRGRKGQTLDGGFGGADIQLGLRTTRAVKRLGCSLLKSFIEDDKLLFWDYDILQELVSFVSKNQSFEAETNHTDDLVMCLVLFGWLTTQGYFKDMVNMDIRKQIFDERLKEIEEELTPFGFIEAGYDSEVEIDDQGTGWYLADPKY
jgi:hypothetical protein